MLRRGLLDGAPGSAGLEGRTGLGLRLRGPLLDGRLPGGLTVRPGLARLGGLRLRLRGRLRGLRRTPALGTAALGTAALGRLLGCRATLSFRRALGLLPLLGALGLLGALVLALPLFALLIAAAAIARRGGDDRARQDEADHGRG